MEEGEATEDGEERDGRNGSAEEDLRNRLGAE